MTWHQMLLATSCNVTQQTRVQRALDDVAGSMCVSLDHGPAVGRRGTYERHPQVVGVMNTINATEITV